MRSEAGSFHPSAYILSSTLKVDHMKQAVEGFMNSTEKLTKKTTKRTYAMSDSEMCYRESLHEKMAANNLMCYFHVKQDSKMYLLKHHKASQEEKANAWRQVASDIDVIRGALNEEDFTSRAAAIKEKWLADGVHISTEWNRQIVIVIVKVLVVVIVILIVIVMRVRKIQAM